MPVIFFFGGAGFFWYIYLSLLLQELCVALCQVLTVLCLLVLNTYFGL